MTGFTQSKIVVGWGLNWKLKVSRFSGCSVWMIGIKLVHVCEGVMRYPVG